MKKEKSEKIVLSSKGNSIDVKEVRKKLLEHSLIKESDSIQLFFEKGYQDFFDGWLVRFVYFDNLKKIKIRDEMYLENFDGKTVIKRDVIFKKE